MDKFLQKFNEFRSFDKNTRTCTVDTDWNKVQLCNAEIPAATPVPHWTARQTKRMRWKPFRGATAKWRPWLPWKH